MCAPTRVSSLLPRDFVVTTDVEVPSAGSVIDRLATRLVPRCFQRVGPKGPFMPIESRQCMHTIMYWEMLALGLFWSLIFQVRLRVLELSRFKCGGRVRSGCGCSIVLQA